MTAIGKVWHTLRPLRRRLRTQPNLRRAWARLLGRYGTDVWIRLIHRGDTVVDIGANDGYYSFFASWRAGPFGKVFSLEPYEPSFEELTDEMRRFPFRNTTALCIAASDRHEARTLYVQPGYSPANSLFPLSEERTGFPSVTVRCMPLDDMDVPQHVNVIKLDVEGAEYRVIAGMKRILSHNRDIRLFIEFNPERLHAASTSAEELFELLQSHGFAVAAICERQHRLLPIDTVQDLRDLFRASQMMNCIATRRPHPEHLVQWR